MSKLLDRLERINRGAPAAMGFGAAARAEKVPPMALVGMLSSRDSSAQGASVLAKIGADAALISGGGEGEVPGQVAQALDSVPWGLRVQGLKGEEASHYREQGCDFLAFEPEGALLGAIEKNENTAYLLCIQPDMETRSLRAIEHLPVDAVLLSLDSVEPPLTLQHLITVGAVRSAFSKYLLLQVPGVLTRGELEALRDMGVNGLVVDANALSAEELEGMKESLLNLPRPQGSKSRRASAILPRTDPGPSSTPIPVEEEEDEEDF
jgi:hypothetical protein